MKKISGLLILFASILIVSCASTSTFSSEAPKSSGNIVISTDEFAGTKTAEYKSRKLDAVFAKGTNSMNFEPSFVSNTDNNSVTIWLKVKFTCYTNISDSMYEKIIFLSDKGRLTVKLSPNQQSPEILYRNQLFGTQCRTICNVQLSNEEYLKLNDFISNSSSIKCAAYTTSNKAIEMTEEGSSAHNIFAELYSYYNENLRDSFVIPTTKSIIE